MSDEPRDQRLGKAMERELSMILGSASDPRLQDIPITGVEARQQGKHCRVFFGPPHGSPEEHADIEGPDQVRELLEKARGYVRSELASSLNLKMMPDLSFKPDPVRWAAWKK